MAPDLNFRSSFILNLLLDRFRRCVRPGWVIPVILSVQLALSGCGEDSTGPGTEPPPVLTPVEVDSIWVLGSERMHRIAVRVTPAEPSAGDEMACVIDGPGQVGTFRMFDDGGFGRWVDAPDFADSLSGDHLPGDGVFARRINAAFADREGEYRFTFTLSSQPASDPLQVDVTVRRNSPPVFSVVIMPDSVPSGSRGLSFTAMVHDPDGDDDIASVGLIHPASPGLTYPMERTDDSVWVWLNEPSIAAGLTAGFYTFVIRASDYYLDQIDSWVESDPDSCWLENLPPAVVTVDGPDTVWVSPSDAVQFSYVISVTDDQGSLDLDSLLLVISDPDSVVEQYFYFDGVGLDTVVGDGRFVAGFSADAGSRIGVVFTFAWTPTDRSPQRGETYYTTLIILRGEGLIGSGAVRRFRAGAAGRRSLFDRL